jgi:tetratricopeptide (TPR) repeat protein
MRRRGLWLGLLVGIFALFAAAGWLIKERWVRSTLDQARRDMAAQRFATARSRLAQLVSFPWFNGEAAYLLGFCEEATGHPDAALSAWSRVPARSSFSGSVALRRAIVQIKRGRCAEGEEILTTALRQPAGQAIALRDELIALYWMQGREDEAFAQVEANWSEKSRPGWPRPDEAIEAIRTHIAMRLEPPDGDDVRNVLERAAKQAPEDDRIWLGRANLASRTGRLDEAETWLDACRKRRPDDPVVWRARLNWAKASSRPSEVWQALTHLSADRLTAAEVEALRAWLAATRGDAHGERDALERLVELEPANISALERLAVLAIGVGDTERGDRFRRRKAELDHSQDRFERLFKEDSLATLTAEMARLAETLGYTFEAGALWTLAAWRSPTDHEASAALARLERASVESAKSRRSLAELLTGLLAPSAPPAASPPRTIARQVDAPPKFQDDATAAGLKFVFESGDSPSHQLPEVMSGGVGVLDYDGDGWLDVYCVQGGPFPPNPRSIPLGDRLFQNKGNGTFRDATKSSGLDRCAPGYGHGVAVGDIDNDGDPDLFVTRWRRYALYRNRGDGRFEDVTAEAGLAGDRDWPTSAAFADLDNDGDLDLYVCHYAVWNAEDPKLCRNEAKGVYESCDPRSVAAVPDHVFRNDGGRFIDVTAEAGIVDRDGRGLGVVAADLDDDGLVDLFVANDGTANEYFHNLGGFRFEELALSSGLAGNANGGYQAGMGVGCGDLDGDGRVDLVVTNFAGESTTFYQNLGGGMFADRTAAVGLAVPSRPMLGFGVALIDVNNDGRLDLLSANGHVNDFRPSTPFAMPMQLFLGGDAGRLTDVSSQAGQVLVTPRLGRGLAPGDLDNDGRLDAILVSRDEPLAYVHNQTTQSHFVAIRLQGSPSNRDAVGAKVTLEAGGRRQVAHRFGGGSYQSAADPRLHFGLGKDRQIEQVEVKWPSGRVDRFRDLAADRGYLIREGDLAPKALPGWPRLPQTQAEPK